MDKIKHHLNEPLLLGYATGSLPEAFNLIVAAHLEMCDLCRAHLASFDAIGGALLEDAAPAGAVDLDAVMSRLDNEADAPITLVRPSGVLPHVLRDYIGGDLDAVNWRAAGMGVRQAILPTSREASIRLLHIPAGAAVPDHGHRGTELTLVLQGAFSDDTDRFARGDMEIADQDLEHKPMAEPGEDCICLAATDAPLRFKGWIPKLAQPFLRI